MRDDKARAADRDQTPERGSTADRDATPARMSAPGPEAGPESPTELRGTGWWAALKRTLKEFQEDNISDWAAALTYYGVLSVFPGLLVAVAVLGLLGETTTAEVERTATGIVPGAVGEILRNAFQQAGQNAGTAGFAAILGLAIAFWSASGYIAAFMRASNAIYDVPEGRPIWKTLPIRLGVTAVVGLMLLVSALIVVFTGDLAEQTGQALGLGSAVVTVWNIAKWPVLLVLVSLMFAILYWASPNARHGGFRWVSPGGVFAVVVWLIASGAFAFYVANFGNYNKTYGALAGVIIFLLWLWISNIAILMGAELDAELERGRVMAAGHPEDKEPFLQVRDDRKVRKGKDSTLG
jgi:membrane protein